MSDLFWCWTDGEPSTFRCRERGHDVREKSPGGLIPRSITRAAELPELTIVAIRDMAYIKKRNGWQATGYDGMEAGTNAWMDGLLYRTDDRAQVLRIGSGA
jgi:hypothetical protein